MPELQEDVSKSVVSAHTKRAGPKREKSESRSRLPEAWRKCVRKNNPCPPPGLISSFPTSCFYCLELRGSRRAVERPGKAHRSWLLPLARGDNERSLFFTLLLLSISRRPHMSNICGWKPSLKRRSLFFPPLPLFFSLFQTDTGNCPPPPSPKHTFTLDAPD